MGGSVNQISLPKYFIGIDGGGTGTRAIITTPDSKIAIHSDGPPSALGHGVENSWRVILDLIAKAFAKDVAPVPSLNQCWIGLGLSGVNNPIWKNEFLLRQPGFAHIELESDGFTTLLGAHQGQRGAIIALGTGTVAMSWDGEQSIKSISGWGFPSGDEASGAWIGLRIASLVEKSLDGRRAKSPLSEAVLSNFGGSSDSFITWLGSAKQSAFASLAPLAFKFAKLDPDVDLVISDCCAEVETLAKTLNRNGQFPLAVCGRIGSALIPHLNPNFANQLVSAKGTSADGALYLLRRRLHV
jgi:glucosamine kinase